jgi:hypothetical protein
MERGSDVAHMAAPVVIRAHVAKAIGTGSTTRTLFWRA